MTSPTKLIYHCSTGRLSGWAAALHLGGLSSDLSTLKPLFDRAQSEPNPGAFVLIGRDDLGIEVYAWQHGRSLPVFRKAFSSMDTIFGIGPELTMFVTLDLPPFKRFGMLAMLNAFASFGDTEILNWARPELQATVQSAIASLKGAKP